MSTGTIQARPTLYKGIRMRSRLEADYASSLDRRGIDWQYEPTCFGGPDGQWLPDFKTGTGHYVEVKRADGAARMTAQPIVITVFGKPAPQGSKRAFAVRGKGGIPTGKIAVIESSRDRVQKLEASGHRRRSQRGSAPGDLAARGTNPDRARIRLATAERPLSHRPEREPAARQRTQVPGWRTRPVQAAASHRRRAD